MSVQTSYNSAPDIGYEGQVIEADKIATFWSEDGVYPGRAVVQGTDTTSAANKYNDRLIPFGVKLPSGADNVVGIALLQANLPNDTSGEPHYPDQATDNDGPLVSVLKQGSMYVVAGEDVTARDPVYTVNSVGDSGLALGDLIKDAVAGTTGTAILVPNSYWATSASAGVITKIVLGSDPEV